MNDPRGPATLAPDTEASAFDRDALARAIDALRASAAARDRTGGHAAQEKQWLAEAGLL
ncbi:Acyl-CoA dehydrogenase-like protein, partial [Burkholderia sp. TJI49]